MLRNDDGRQAFRGRSSCRRHQRLSSNSGVIIRASVKITGGSVEQFVENVYLYTMGACRYSDDGKIKTRQVVFDKHLIADAFIIRPNETITTTTE